jgi:hypothetical protein
MILSSKSMSFTHILYIHIKCALLGSRDYCQTDFLKHLIFIEILMQVSIRIFKNSFAPRPAHVFHCPLQSSRTSRLLKPCVLTMTDDPIAAIQSLHATKHTASPHIRSLAHWKMTEWLSSMQYKAVRSEQDYTMTSVRRYRWRIMQMHQQSLDHSYCKRETLWTKFRNSQSVMILVVRLGQLTDNSKSEIVGQIVFQTWRSIS